GIVEYRHLSSRSGGAQYAMGPSAKQDMLVVDAEAFRRDAAGDDYSLNAIIAHERGHQLVCRHSTLMRTIPPGMSAITEEVLASLVGALIVEQPADAEVLVLKALGELVKRGMELSEASRRVEQVLLSLEAVL